MSSEYSVRLSHVNKTFQLTNFFKKNDETGKRAFYTKKIVDAVKDIDFGIRPGEIFGMLGPNGAGKTTTIKMISGLIRPTSGEVYVDGLHVESKRLQVLQRVGVVLEGTRTCIWPLTPMENLAYFGRLKDVNGSILKDRSHQLLDFIGLKDKKDVEVRKLSRGQKQKLAICIALIADPPVILLDEPTTGLDVQSSRAIKDKVREMAAEQRKTVLVTTHDMHVAQELCDRIGIINEGKLVVCKPTSELLALFEDQVLELRVDRAPNCDVLNHIEGVIGAEISEEADRTNCLVKIVNETANRSTAIYAVMEALKSQGITLYSVTQRQQTLENVFLRLTTSTM